jgi:predicted nucleotidyltransferase
VIDALPADPASLALGTIEFAKSGHVMSLVGLDLALAHNVPVHLDATTTLDVATVPVITVLKMTAWLDRAADRHRDLDDLAHILEDYLEPHDHRRWDDDIIEAGIAYEDQSAFALGRDAGSIAGASHLRIIEHFLAVVSDETSAHNAVFTRCFGRHAADDVLARRLCALKIGLGLGHGRGDEQGA